VYAKERRLLAEVKSELAQGRKVQIYAVYTQKRDVTRRLQRILREGGVRAEVLTADTPPEQREAWYARQLKNGMQVCICHPKLVPGPASTCWNSPRSSSMTRLLHLRTASGKPAKLADRAETSRPGRLLDLRRHSPGKLSPPDG
jgi:hypothetical protein